MEKFPSIVADIMRSPVITVDMETNARDAAILMTRNRIGSIIVTEFGKPTGIITKRDMIQKVVSLCRDPCGTAAGEIMSSPLITTNKEMGIMAAMREMRDHKVSQLVVMEGGKTVGIIAEREVIRAVSIASLASFTPLTRI